MESHAVTTSLMEGEEHFSKFQGKWDRFKGSFGKGRIKSSHAFTVTAFRQYMAEVLGTLLIVYVGTGTVVALAAKDSLNTASTNTCIALSFGFAVACMVYATANVSGGHLNPAITVAFMSTGNINLVKGSLYIVSQCVGAIAASGLVRATTPEESWRLVDGGATRLGNNITVARGVFLELIITYMLIFTVFGTVQLRNSSTGMGKLAGLAIGLAVLVSHTFGQSFTGPGMNPARSLGPAIVFSSWADHWIYWLGPLAGGLLAAITYQFVLQPEDQEKADIRYKKKLLARQQKMLHKQNHSLRRHSFGKHHRGLKEHHAFNPEGPLTIDPEPHHDTEMQDLSDESPKTMRGEDPNFDVEQSSVVSDPSTTRIL